MASMPVPSADETIAEIKAKMMALPEDQRFFEINVSRRSTSGLSQQIASLAGAKFEHITDPIRWLPLLCGGGDYVLHVRHPTEKDRIGGPLPVSFPANAPGMEPRAPNPAVTQLQNWMGPSAIIHPPLLPGMNAQGQFPAPATAQPSGAFATAPQQFGAFAQQPAFGALAPPAAPPDLAVRERELQAQVSALREENARVAAESKARIELENLRRDSETKLRETEARFQAQLGEIRSTAAAAASAAQRPPESSSIEKLLPLLLPLVQQLLQSQNETRIAMMKASADANAAQIALAERQHNAQMVMMQAMQTKPGMSDEMKMLIETLKAQKSDGGGEAVMMTRMMEAMGQVTKQSMMMIETVADIQMGDSEHPVVGAIREGVKAMSTLAAGAREGARKVVTPQQRQLMAQQQAAATAVAQAQQRNAQAAQVAAQQRAQAAQTVQAQPQPGPRVVEVGGAAATPVPTAPAPVVQFEQPAAPAPVPVSQAINTAQPPPQFFTHFDVLKQGISEARPIEEVAQYFINLAKVDDPSLVSALEAHNGSPYELLQATFGGAHIAANFDYFKGLGQRIDAMGEEAGLWGAEDEEDDAGTDEDADTDSEHEDVQLADVSAAGDVVPIAAPATVVIDGTPA